MIVRNELVETSDMVFIDNMLPVAPTLFAIRHLTSHDTAKNRTIVFFKGCKLNCFWCCNPEEFLEISS